MERPITACEAWGCLNSTAIAWEVSSCTGLPRTEVTIWLPLRPQPPILTVAKDLRSQTEAVRHTRHYFETFRRGSGYSARNFALLFTQDGSS